MYFWFFPYFINFYKDFTGGVSTLYCKYIARFYQTSLFIHIYPYKIIHHQTNLQTSSKNLNISADKFTYKIFQKKYVHLIVLNLFSFTDSRVYLHNTIDWKWLSFWQVGTSAYARIFLMSLIAKLEIWRF